jgi:16S rRNA (guanine966-N2)-methyltransferase
VISGASRGRRLSSPLPKGVRPTSDRVRESIFDILGSRGGVEGLRVLDLFCGSGALGLEALSRGAASATFVDEDPGALEAARANARAVGLGERPARFVRARLPGWLVGQGPVDIAFCDPPYTFSEWGVLLGALSADLAVLESGTEVDVDEDWAVARARRYGGTLITVVRRRDAADRRAEGVS